MLWLIDGSGGESHLRRSWRNWFPVRMLEPAHLCQRRKKITNVSLDPCRLPLVARLPLSLFPLGRSELNIFLLSDQRRLRTINHHRDLVVDSLHIVNNAGQCLVDVGYPVVDASHSIIDILRALHNLGGAVTIRTSSFVSLSSLFSPSSMSLFPSNLVKYFSASFLN